MDSRFDDIKKIRKVILKMVDEFSAAQLNEIPEGFNHEGTHFGYIASLKKLITKNI